MQSDLKRWLVVGCAAAATIAAAGRCWADDWPRVEPLSKKQAFINPGARATDTPFFALIRDFRGNVIYKFECHNGNYDRESVISFSGDFQCALFAVKAGKPASGNLLAATSKDEQSADWWNRGRMRSAQLQGKCLAYPEYSTDRQFRVRGMLVTMRFADVCWSAEKNRQVRPMLKEFTFTLDVVPERSAQSAVAELPTGRKPPGSCYP